MRFGPGGAATAPLRPGATTTALTSRRPEPTYIALYAQLGPKSRLVVDIPDTSDKCLSRLLGVRPRPRTAGAAPGASSAEAGPRWGGAETKHTVQVQQPSGKSSARGALAPCLALESSWKAQTRVFCPDRGVSHDCSRPRQTKTLALGLASNILVSISAPPAARSAAGRTRPAQVVVGGYFNSIH